MKHYVLFTKDDLENMLEGLEICHTLSTGETVYFMCKEKFLEEEIEKHRWPRV